MKERSCIMRKDANGLDVFVLNRPQGSDTSLPYRRWMSRPTEATPSRLPRNSDDRRETQDSRSRAP